MVHLRLPGPRAAAAVLLVLGPLGAAGAAQQLPPAPLSGPERPRDEAFGPGLGNRTWSRAELFQPISVIVSPLGHGRVAMVKGWLLLIYKSDGGGQPDDGGIELWDVSDPASPALVAQFDDADTHGLREAHGFSFARVGTRDYMATQSLLGVQLWDVTDPLQLELTSELDLPGINGGDYEGVWWVFWQAPWIFAAGRSQGLFVIDASDPTAPQLVTQVPTGAMGGISPGMVYAVGDLLLLAQPQSGAMAVLDASDPLAPKLLHKYSFQNGYSHLFAGGHMFTSGGDGGPEALHVYDVTHAGQIAYVGSAGSALGNGGYASWQDGIVHSGFSDRYAAVDPVALQVLGTGSSGIPGRDEDFAQVLGNLVFVANDHGQGSALIPHRSAPDTAGPEVDWVWPADGAQDLPLTTRLGISTSDQVDPGSAHPGSVRLFSASGKPIPGYVSVHMHLVSFAPAKPLAPNTTYRLEVEGLRDAVGNAGGAFASTFRTGDPPPPPGPVENVSAASGKPYATGTLALGAKMYIDREYTYTALPPELVGQPYVLTANDDKASVGAQFLTFDLLDDSTVWVLYVEGYGQLPGWLAGWDAQPGVATILGYLGAFTDYELFTADFPAGPVALGGNLEPPAQGVSSMYAVAVVPKVAPACGAVQLAPAEVGALASLDVQATGHGPLAYSWDFGDGTPRTAPSPSSQATHAYAQPGRYPVQVTVSNPWGSASSSAVQIAHTAPTALAPSRSSPIAWSDGRVFTVNPDNDTVTAILDAELTVAWERPAGDHPRTLAVAPDGTVWVASQDDDTLRVLDPAGGQLLATIPLPRASRPYGVAFAPDGSYACATLEATGELVMLTPAGGVVGSVALGAAARGLAIAADSQKILVTRFVSPATHGEVWRVDAGALAVDSTLQLAYDPGPDAENSGRGVPNYLTALAISPDGTRAIVPSKKDNTARGLYRDGTPLTFESRTRAIVSQLDLMAPGEDLAARVDVNDRNMPQAGVWSPLGDLFLVATQGTNTVEVYDAASGAVVSSLATDRAPQGLCFDGTGARLFVHEFMSRSVAVYDTAGLLAAATAAAPLVQRVPTVASEVLSPQVLLGKQLFYDAEDLRLSLDGYISCAGCHLDEGSDGQVWDFTQAGEGLRNTIDLLGRAGTGHGNVHWTANFDEIQDFENDIRTAFAGTGLMTDPDFAATQAPLGPPKAGKSADLDALAAYVESLGTFRPSPYRQPDGSLTPAAVSGQALFVSLGCATCHTPPTYTDGLMHDVGTLGPGSGATTTAIDTPTLRSLWSAPPYLHDGSAPTLTEVLSSAAHGGTDVLTGQQRADLAAFLRQLE